MGAGRERSLWHHAALVRSCFQCLGFSAALLDLTGKIRISHVVCGTGYFGLSSTVRLTSTARLAYVTAGSEVVPKRTGFGFRDRF